MWQFLDNLEDPPLWLVDLLEGSVLYLTERGEIVTAPDDIIQMVVPKVPYTDPREVAAAAERLFARAAMMHPSVHPDALADHFWYKEVGPCAYRVWLAGEELALPDPEWVGGVFRSSTHFGMFIYADAVYRVRE